MPTRREALVRGGISVLALGLRARRADAGGSQAPPPFTTDLPIPPVLAPTRSDDTTDYYELVQRAAEVEILPGRKTPIWGYNGAFPGPTISAQCGRYTAIRITNELGVHTAMHLHGGVNESASDGFPTDMVPPGESRTYTFANHGRAATLWYHDHAMDHTGQNIYMGLSGLYLLRDDHEQSLPLPKDEYDVPLVIQQRDFRDDGTFAYSHGNRAGLGGGLTLVNGAVRPRLKVAARKYRFRILNGSNATRYRLALSTGDRLHLIANDAGLLPAAVPAASIPLAMAERVEVVVDFSTRPVGSQLTLRDLDGQHERRDILRFDVVRAEADDSEVPRRLCDMETLSPQSAVRTRKFVFTVAPAVNYPPFTWRINGRAFDPDRCDAQVRLGDVEIWHLINRRMLGFLGMLHPVHVHLASFQILDRNGRPPLSHERGWKDTVALDPGEDVRILVRFEHYRGRYLIHCHNLEHEDHTMMSRFDVG